MRKKKITRDEVLSYATEIIKQDGIDNCTIRNIAMHSNVAVGTIYNYFSSHNELLQKVFEHSWAATISRLKDSLKEVKSPNEKIKVYSNILINEIKNRNGLGGIVLLNRENPIALDGIHKNIFDELSKIMAEIMKESTKNKDLPHSTLTMLSRWANAGIFSHITSRLCSDDEFIEQLVYRFL